MPHKTFFNFPAYLKTLTEENRLAATCGFRPSVCSGVQHIEGLLQEFQRTANFVCTSDICEESTLQRGGGWFKRRVFTVFILMRYRFGDTADQAAKMATVRELFRQFQSRILRDSQDLENNFVYVNTADIRSRELGGSFLSGCTGLYFMLSMDEPTDLCFRRDEWAIPTFDNTFDKSFL